MFIRPTSKPKATFEPYDPRYPEIAKLVIDAIKKQSSNLAVDHIGSTAAPGCGGKGIIDLLVVYPIGTAEQTIALMEKLGLHRQGPEFRHRDSFPEGHHVRIGELVHDGRAYRCYVHAVPEDSYEVRRFRIFRDRLMSDSELLARYVAIKHEAIESGVVDTDDYVVRKINVIKEILGNDYGDPRTSFVSGSALPSTASPKK